ncbi:MAG: citrate synthase [Oscillospiraceae bacterium]|jgi:citrate synthase|nr:citrate synthase [Oscillospiraceae bacterium]
MSEQEQVFSKDELQAQFSTLSHRMEAGNAIAPEAYRNFDVKRGLRNADGTGVMAGLTKVCAVDGYYIKDGEKVPQEGRLFYRGIDVSELIAGANAENRFGYEETAWLLLFGTLPTKADLELFHRILASCRELPRGFIEDVIMKTPSPDIMNKMAHSVLSLYPFDPNPDDTSIENVLRQSIWLIAQMPAIMTSAYQVKRRVYDKRSMYLHQMKPEHSIAETVLRSIRSDKQFTPEEARILDVCLILHADHGGGNNSTFATRCVTSTGTDTYSALAAGIGSLKGPRHGGANIQVAHMVQDMQENISDITDEGQVFDYLCKRIRKQTADKSGLIFGMGHAVYTLSDPRAKTLKAYAKDFSAKNGYEADYRLLELVEELTPRVMAEVKASKKPICANVDLYSGLLYRMLGIPQDLFTPLFALARTAGWCAHRLEELQTGGKIMRPAYKNVAGTRAYLPLHER